MEPEEMAAMAVGAILSGSRLMLYLPNGEHWPPGWPRGYLMSTSDKGKNVSFDPLKVLGFMQKIAKEAEE